MFEGPGKFLSTPRGSNRIRAKKETQSRPRARVFFFTRSGAFQTAVSKFHAASPSPRNGAVHTAVLNFMRLRRITLKAALENALPWLSRLFLLRR